MSYLDTAFGTPPWDDSDERVIEAAIEEGIKHTRSELADVMSEVLWKCVDEAVYAADDIEDHIDLIKERVYDEINLEVRKLWEE